MCRSESNVLDFIEKLRQSSLPVGLSKDNILYLLIDSKAYNCKILHTNKGDEIVCTAKNGFSISSKINPFMDAIITPQISDVRSSFIIRKEVHSIVCE
jgi:hypothetical protein